MFYKLLLITSLLSIIIARENVLQPIVMPEIDSILNTLIARTNDTIQQIENTVKILSPKDYVRNLVVVLRGYRSSVWVACDEMQILDSVVKLSKIDSVIVELHPILGNTDHLLKSANEHILPLLEYLKKALKTLIELNSDNEGVSDENKMQKQIFKSISRIYNKMAVKL
jgi:hypothetical protein